MSTMGKRFQGAPPKTEHEVVHDCSPAVHITGRLFVALACTAMMALMMAGMSHADRKDG